MPTGNADIGIHLIKLEHGIVGITTAGRGYLVALYGNDEASLGLLRGRLDSLSAYFCSVFEQLK